MRGSVFLTLLIALTFSILSISFAADSGVNVERIYMEHTGHGVPVEEVKPVFTPPSPGDRPYIPVVIPPEVERVWVVDHLNEEGDLVAGHWVFIKRPARWYIEEREKEWRRRESPREVPIAPPKPGK